MIENTWGTTNRLYYNEEGCTTIGLGMNGTFKYTVTDDNKIINEDNWFKELVYPIQDELNVCFNAKSFKSYEDILSSKEELAKCIKENIKVDGIEYNEIIISDINLPDDSKEQYDACKTRNKTTTDTKELITPDNKNNNKTSSNTIYFIIGVAVVLVILIALILVKVLKKKNVSVDNNVNIQNSSSIDNNQNNTLQ